MRLFDGHCHLRPGNQALLIEQMNSLGIEKAAVVAGGTLSKEQLSRQMSGQIESNFSVPNLEVLDSCRAYPGRLLPFFFANPGSDLNLYSMRGPEFFGLKLGPAVHGVPFSDPNVHASVRLAQDFGHVVYTHCLSRNGFKTESLVELARQFPKVSFILGHAGIGNCDFHSIELIRSEKNIYFETSGGFYAVIQAACERLGTHRVLFGTEYPLQHPSLEIHKLSLLNLPQTDAENIFFRNMQTLLKGDCGHAA